MDVLKLCDQIEPNGATSSTNLEQDLETSMEKIETINFHEEKEVNGIKFWAYNAGHVLGAAMFMIEVGRCMVARWL